jgi:hypothetical protein
VPYPDDPRNFSTQLVKEATRADEDLAESDLREQE